MLFFGLTGGIASGKSTVARVMLRDGVGVVDADQIARDIVAPGSSCLQEVIEVFGAEMLAPDGTLDRRKLGSVVFSDVAALRKLEAITHPHIRDASQLRAQELANDGHRLIAYEAALLVENGLADKFRPLVVVAVDEATQLARLMRRDQLSSQDAAARVGTQVPMSEKVAVADYVIDSSGTIAEVEARTREVVDQIRARADQPLPALPG